MKLVRISGLAVAFALGGTSGAFAVVINNDIPSGTSGHLGVDVGNGGETRTVTFTGNGQVSGLLDGEIVYDYFTYIDTGSSVFRLSDSTVTSSAALVGDDEVSSAGYFTGSNGNRIDWTTTSSIDDGGSLMTSAFTFDAESGDLGDLTLFQYLDEDVFGISDDVFFTRGSAGAGSLELFTVDLEDVVGISHGGAYSATQGLVNAEFVGWAADTFDEMRPRIGAGAQTLAPGGVIESSLVDAGTSGVTGVGTARGPSDIVSVLGWSASADAGSATIITTLGGVPDISVIPDEEPSVVPVPAGMPLLLTGLGAIAALRRKRRA